MFELFYMGGTLFMSILTLIFIAMIAAAVINAMAIFNGQIESEKARHKLAYIKSIGLLGLVVGILGQQIGLFSAFQAIEVMGDVSPALLAGGFKVSMISTLYGFVIYILSLLIWLGLSMKLK